MHPLPLVQYEGTFETDEEHLDRGISIENPRELTGRTDRSLVDLSVGSPGFALPSEARPLEELSVAQALLQMGQPHQTIREEETSLQLVGPVSRGVLESMVTRGRGLTPVAAQIGGPRQIGTTKWGLQEDETRTWGPQDQFSTSKDQFDTTERDLHDFDNRKYGAQQLETMTGDEFARSRDFDRVEIGSDMLEGRIEEMLPKVSKISKNTSESSKNSKVDDPKDRNFKKQVSTPYLTVDNDRTATNLKFLVSDEEETHCCNQGGHGDPGDRVRENPFVQQSNHINNTTS